MEVSDQFHAEAALPPEKEPPIPTLSVYWVLRGGHGHPNASAALPAEEGLSASLGYEVRWAPDPVWTRWPREKFHHCTCRR
jgi:hypothetical protein